MTQRQPAPPAAAPLEVDTQAFDDLFERRNQREAFRRYLEGLRRPAERNQTLTALATAEPIVGAQQAPVQARPWFLSDSPWAAVAVKTRRVAVLGADPAPAPDTRGVLGIDETGDRQGGKKPAQSVVRSWAASATSTTAW